MALDWRFHPQQDLLFERCQGPVDRRQLLELAAVQRGIEGVRRSTRVLSDYRGCEAELTPADLRVLGRERAHRHGGRPLGPQAVVVGSELQYGMARMMQAYFEFYSAPHENRMCIFRSREEALAWLGLDSLPMSA